MHPMVYFDLSVGGNRIPLANGAKTSVEQLLDLTRAAYPEECAQHQLPAALKTSHFEPRGRWQKVMNAVSLAVSGRLITPYEMKNLCRLMYDLPHECKKAFGDIWNSVGLMAYIAVGFRTHQESHHLEDSNRVTDVIKFLESFLREERIKLTSFLCTHRGPSVPGGSWLASHVPEGQVLRALRLQLALIANAPLSEQGTISWIQQTDTLFASVTMFPELFLRYADNGRVGEMLALLADQERQIHSLVESVSSSSSSCSLECLDPYTVEMIRFMRGSFGAGWRSTDFSKQASASPLVTLALESALPEVKRLMPYFARGTGLTVQDREMWIHRNVAECQDPELRCSVRQSMRWFLANQAMHPTAKAVYDTVLYYQWGARCALEKSHFAIGIDRDHSAFQCEAWNLGYRDALAEAEPGSILYARRVEKPDKSDPYLSGLSFRQFWR